MVLAAKKGLYDLTMFAWVLSGLSLLLNCEIDQRYVSECE